MNEEINLINNRYSSNNEIIRKEFKMLLPSIYEFSALMSILNQKDLEEEKLKESRSLIDECFPILSPARRSYKVFFSTLIALNDNRSECVNLLKKNNELFDEEARFKNSMIASAFVLNNLNRNNDIDLIKKTIELSVRFKKEYFYFNKYAYSQQLLQIAALDLSVDEIMIKINKMYQMLKANKIKYSNALSICFILMFSENYSITIQKLVKIHKKLKEDKINFAVYHYQSLLAIYCLIEEFDTTIIQNIKVALDYVTENKVFPSFTLKINKIVHSAFISICTYNLNDEIKQLLQSFLLTSCIISIQNNETAATTAVIM